MFSEMNSQQLGTTQQGADRSTDMSQFILAASRKRNTKAPTSYMSMMLDRHAPVAKRAKTEHKQDLSTDISPPQMNEYLRQQASIHSTVMGPSASLTPMPALDMAPNSLSLSTNAFLMERAARSTNNTAGLYDTFQALSGRNETSLSMTAGLGNLMPGLNNGDVLASQLSSMSNSNNNGNNGLMLDSASNMAARQRLNLAQGMTAASMMPNTTGMRRTSLTAPTSNERSLLLERASMNALQGVSSMPQRSITQRSSLGVPGISSADRAFLRTLLGAPALDQMSSPAVGGMASFQNQLCSPVGSGTSPLPMILANPQEDNRKLSEQQVFLRHQIEVFEATQDDVTTHTRGRNKPIRLGQVGIRCKHCAKLPVVQRQKGSTYFPATLLGLYQAAQNMSTTHMQSGLCREMPQDIKTKFANFQTNKVTSSGAGRPYWANAAKQLGLVDTPEDGIRHFSNVPLSF